MAPRRSATIKKENIRSVGLTTIFAENIATYGSYVIESRAVPDYRDGLKMVQRRVLYSLGFSVRAHSDGSFIKSARVTGDTIGKFHPHSQVSVYDALCNMINSSVPPVAGDSNFGWYGDTDRPAAERYTECRLSKYGDDYLLDPKYVRVVPHVSNYDGKDREPVYLPALLPNLLLNGTFGIGVGIPNTVVPPFTPESVVKLVDKVLKGGKVTAKDCLKTLQFNYIYGGECVSDEEDLLAFYSTGGGSLSFKCDYTYNAKDRQYIITGIYPLYFSNEKLAAKIDEIKGIENFNEASNGELGIRFEIELDKKLSNDELEATKAQVEKLLVYRIGYKLNVATRLSKEEHDKLFKAEGKSRWALFEELNYPDLIHKWVKWRIELEKLYLQSFIDETKQKLAKEQLKFFAISKLDIIFAILKSKADLEPQLVKRLKISADDAAAIAAMTVRELSSLSEQKVKSTIKGLEAAIADYTKRLRVPEKDVLATNAAILAKISKK